MLALLVKHQLVILNRSRERAPNAPSMDRVMTGLCTIFIRPGRFRIRSWSDSLGQSGVKDPGRYDRSLRGLSSLKSDIATAMPPLTGQMKGKTRSTVKRTMVVKYR